jgi:hypothetical protein
MAILTNFVISDHLFNEIASLRPQRQIIIEIASLRNKQKPTVYINPDQGQVSFPRSSAGSVSSVMPFFQSKDQKIQRSNVKIASLRPQRQIIIEIASLRSQRQIIIGIASLRNNGNPRSTVSSVMPFFQSKDQKIQRLLRFALKDKE